LALPDLASGALARRLRRFRSPFFIDGATFSAGAFCRRGRALGCLTMPCADAAPAPNSNANATVDSNLAFLTGFLLWMPPEFPDNVETS
jgi:hypothetical protein